MKLDRIRITTSSNGNKIGKSYSSEFEKKDFDFYTDSSKYFIDELLHRIFSKEYELHNCENLPDGDYSLDDFREIPIAASIIFSGQEIPVRSRKYYLGYVGSDKV